MKAKKKPIVLDVWQVKPRDSKPKWIRTIMNGQKLSFHSRSTNIGVIDYALISTLEGKMEADTGDYIIKGTRGEIWPVRKDIFEETYDIVEGD